MAIDYARLRNTAVTLITDNGRPVTVRSRVQGVQDPVLGTIAITYSDIPAQAVFVDITDRNRPETEIRDGDKMCFVTEACNTDDQIIDSADGEAWEVVTVEEKYPGSTKLVWRVVVRK